MNIATVLLTWNRSTSSDVVRQILTITANDGSPSSFALDPYIESYEMRFPEKTHIKFELVADDGTYESEVVSTSFEVPDLTPPEPPTNFQVTRIS